MLLTRAYQVESLMNMDFRTAVTEINNVLSQKLSETEALKKLMNLRQGSKNMMNFISEIERMGTLSFIHSKATEAREQCMIAAFLSGLSNKQVEFELRKFHGKNKNAKFRELCSVAMELTAMISGDRDNSDDMVCNVNYEDYGTNGERLKPYRRLFYLY